MGTYQTESEIDNKFFFYVEWCEEVQKLEVAKLPAFV